MKTIAELLSTMKAIPNMLVACTTRLLQGRHIMADIIPKCETYRFCLLHLVSKRSIEGRGSSSWGEEYMLMLKK